MQISQPTVANNFVIFCPIHRSTHVRPLFAFQFIFFFYAITGSQGKYFIHTWEYSLFMKTHQVTSAILETEFISRHQDTQYRHNKYCTIYLGFMMMQTLQNFAGKILEVSGHSVAS